MGPSMTNTDRGPRSPRGSGEHLLGLPAWVTMTDLLHRILADPHLRQWPQRTPHPVHPAACPEPPESAGVAVDDAEPESAGLDDPSAAINKMRNLIDPFVVDDIETMPPPPAPSAVRPESVDTVAPTTGDDTAENNSDDNNPANTPADTDDDSADPRSDSTVPAGFDDIAAQSNVFADRIADAKEWARSINWKKPATLAYAAAAVVTILTAVWAVVAGSGAEPQVPTAQIASAPSPADPIPARSAPAVDAPIPASAVVSASARCPAPSSDPMNALRPESAQPWICVRAWQIDGQLLKITFARPYVISAVGIIPGASAEIDGEDQWLKYRTVSRLSWTFNDPARTTVVQTTGDRRELLSMPVTSTSCDATPDCPIVASAVTLTIQSTSEPSNPGSIEATTTRLGGADYTAFAVSHIEIIGHPAS